MTADAITIDKLAVCCYICREQDSSKNRALWDTGADLSYRRRLLADTDEEQSAEKI